MSRRQLKKLGGDFLLKTTGAEGQQEADAFSSPSPPFRRCAGGGRKRKRKAGGGSATSGAIEAEKIVRSPSEPESEGEDLAATSNPFAVEESEEEEGGNKEKMESDEEEPFEFNLPRLEHQPKRRGAGEQDEAEEKELGDIELAGDDEVESAPSGDEGDAANHVPAGAASIFAISLKAFDPQLEMARIAGARLTGTVGAPRTKPPRTVVGRRNQWLCPKSELLEFLDHAASGIRWEGFDPRRERYYEMRSVTGADGRKRFCWTPTERYLASFSILEDIIARSDVTMLHEFCYSDQYPFHPTANLLLAESYLHQDEFEASFRFVLRALNAFQIALNFTFSPTTLVPHHHSILLDQLEVADSAQRPIWVCHPAHPDVLLTPIDPRDVADGLAHVADDLVVDWDGRRAEQGADRRTRREELESALSRDCFGNLTFIKILHFYAWSLVQRGCPRTALEVFRLTYAMAYENDYSHSLIHIANAAIRARQTDILTRFIDRTLIETLDAALAMPASTSTPGLIETFGSFKFTERPFSFRLDFAVPQYAFSVPLAMLRALPPKTHNTSGFLRELEMITAAEFWDFIVGSARDSFTFTPALAETAQGRNQFCIDAMGKDGKLLTPLREELRRGSAASGTNFLTQTSPVVDGSGEGCAADFTAVRLVHLMLLRALWLFPAFPHFAVSHTESKLEFSCDNLRLDKNSDRIAAYIAITVSGTSSGLTRAIKSFRTSLVDAYCKQTKELWRPLLSWVHAAWIHLDKLCVLEHSLIPPITIASRNFRVAGAGVQPATSPGRLPAENLLLMPELVNPILKPLEVRSAMQVSAYLAFPGLFAQYLGVRASEFDPRQPVFPDMLLNFTPETTGTPNQIARRAAGAAPTTSNEMNPLQRWFARFSEGTGRMNPNSNTALLFLQSLLPWSQVDSAQGFF